ncbi:dipeptidyl aminopeptidase/acylaminoacyl peptidase [Streptosporangium becharense]|uniref:Dipeptidyl aminopeptidase/acylaminoacyl peptidase n=1 Tax=Streptosporangium becharense TaxID=1816182 RepID=A0A7W9IKL3_9ACTN|nr:prolyl oligopeptidase family serine peptidase [Streptosporangium becharense]MBB2911836.1 dipeptidyl aminopeptidase/acylaminoacyl peptidase [Streptosporangium becharense]MBB5822346.1 dipeptidyl aminopeptidase/acylaminoacyl peptidase [Streptosporangium becharense]
MTPFDDIRDYVGVPRATSLRLSPDGSRLVCVVQALNPDGRSYGTALWEVPLDGRRPHRLTRSVKGEAGAEFTASGDVLFGSRRPDPTVRDADEEVPALWLLPATAGEARQVASRPGGVTGFATGGRTVVFTSDVLPGDEATEAERRGRRKDAGISAILHEDHLVRYWDHDLGPGETRLFAGTLGDDERLSQVRDLTPQPGKALTSHASYDVTPDGATVVTTWGVPLPHGELRFELVAIETADGGARRVLAAGDGLDFGGPVKVSPDGRLVACVRGVHGAADRVPESALWIVDLATGEGRPAGGGLWPVDVAWAPDSRSLFVAADHLGRRPIFRVPADGSAPVRLTSDDAAYLSLGAGPDGSVYALRSAVDAAPAPVRVTADGRVERLASPVPAPEPPGTLTEVTATADDGTAIRAWLVLPEGASAENPAPFLLWVHGGPLASWNDWSWRWNPWIMARNGYAVLLPDPCLSTGYGPEMIRRGWADWGPRTYADLMAVTDAALELPEVDASRTAMMGGSFGGYMANWIAGHTDRFKAIVTHAALWNLGQFAGTTDGPMFWQREFGEPGGEAYDRLSPHAFLDRISTPMLVVHGDKDYRVPIGEGLRLWWDLRRSGVESKFLYFPDENHWVLKPGNVVVWYETVLAFLAQHVLGREWKRPESLS